MLPSYDSVVNQSSSSDVSETDPLVGQLQREVDSLRAQLTLEMESNKTKQYVFYRYLFVRPYL